MNNPDCIFCKIATGEIPKDFFYRDAEFMVFADIHPAAPTHLLVLPNDHILRSMAEVTPELHPMLGRMFQLARTIAEKAGVADDGYRLVFNVRHHAGQEVDHLHLHILGGQVLGPLG